MRRAADTWRCRELTNVSLLLCRNLVTSSAAANQCCQEVPGEQTSSSLLLCRNLYEVFCNVRDDEQEHVKTMHACADYSIVEQIAKMKVRLLWGCTRPPADLSGTWPTCMSDSAAMLHSHCNGGQGPL